MKNFRSFSMKGFNSRSLSVCENNIVKVEDNEVKNDELKNDELKPGFWEFLPIEILRDVLMRVEESEDLWPDRKSVIGCGGVCRTWRELIKEMVKTPEISAKLTFPISLKQPGARDTYIQCYIKRNRGTHTYYLYLSLNEASNEDGKFLLAARKYRYATCSDYVISLNAKDFSKGSSSYIGKLRANFLGSKFTVYDAQPPNAGVKVANCGSSKLVGVNHVSPKFPIGNYPVAHISYELNVLGSRGPRRMSCVMDNIPASSIKLGGGSAPTQTEFISVGSTDSFRSLPFFRSKSTPMEHVKPNILTPLSRTLVMKNKSPRWHGQLQCWCLDFNGRVTVASVKNFQLVAAIESGESESDGSSDDEDEKVIIQFGKVGKDVFTMDYQYPVSAFQAFAISLSSFDIKIACE